MNKAHELLRWIYDDLERDTKLPLWLRDRVRDFLAAEPESDKPVAWITPDGEGFRMRFEPPVNDVPLGWTPLYTKPTAPARKPMTQEEIDKGFSLDWFYGSFVEGIRFAERHHGIGGEG